LIVFCFGSSAVFKQQQQATSNNTTSGSTRSLFSVNFSTQVRAGIGLALSD
jgi:hypothetical protein